MRLIYLLPPGLMFSLLLSFPGLRVAQSASQRQHISQEKINLNFNKDIQPIFDANCVVCHQTGGTQAGLNLESGASYGATVLHNSEESKLLRISPGKPNESYLIHKLEGSHIQVGGTGEQMPTTGPLDKALINIIQKWILEGARKN